MFKRVKLRLKDIRTIGQLIKGEDKIANIMGEEKPSAEHFLLSALKLPDGSAQRVFDHLQVNFE